MVLPLERFCGHSDSTSVTSLDKWLHSLAEQEVRKVLDSLPVELRSRAAVLPLVYDWRSRQELEREGVGDTLGLFVGENFLEAGQGNGGLPAQIILYLHNLWDEAEKDEESYRREVGTTLLHELGHYLGLEEIDLEERGL